MSQVKQIERLMKDVDNERMLRYALEDEIYRLTQQNRSLTNGTPMMCANAAIDAAEQWQTRVKELESKRTALHVKISMLNEEIAALNFALEGSVQKTELLETKIKLYESALLRAFPNGASDGVFELWNEARKLK